MAQGADQAEQGVQVPLVNFNGMLVDGVDHLVFMYSDWDTAIAVFDEQGALIQNIPLPSAAKGMALVGHELFVCEAGEANVTVIDTATRPLIASRMITLTPYVPIDDTYFGGRLWFVGVKSGFSQGLVFSTRIDGSGLHEAAPITGVDHFLRGSSETNGLDLLGSDGDAVTLDLLEVHGSRVDGFREDLNVGYAWTRADAAALPSGGGIILAADPPQNSTDPAAFRQFSTYNGAVMLTYDLPGPGHPNAVDITDANGLMIAGGATSDGGSEVLAFRIGSPEPFWSWHLDAPDLALFPRGIAWSGDGRSIFVVAGNPEAGAAPRLFVLHPFESQRASLAPPTTAPTAFPSPAPAHPAAPKRASEPARSSRSSRGLELGAVLIGALIGAAVALTVIPWRARRQAPAPGSARMVARAQQAVAGALEPGESVVTAVPAHIRVPNRRAAFLLSAALIGLVYLLVRVVPRLPIALGMLMFFASWIVIAVLSRRVARPRQIVLTDRRLLLTENRPWSGLPGPVLSATPLGPHLRADISDGRLTSELFLSTGDGTTRLRVPALGRGRAMWIAQTIDASTPPRPDGDPFAPTDRRRGLALSHVALPVAEPPSRKIGVASALIAAAGVCVLVSAFLPWARLVYYAADQSRRTAQVGRGILPLLVGCALVLSAIFLYRATDRGTRLRWGRTALVGAAILGGYVGFYIVIEPSIAWAALARLSARRTGGTVDGALKAIHSQVAAGVAHFLPSWPFLLPIVAALLAAIGGAIARREALGPTIPSRPLGPPSRAFSPLNSITPGWGTSSGSSRVRRP